MFQNVKIQILERECDVVYITLPVGSGAALHNQTFIFLHPDCMNVLTKWDKSALQIVSG